MDKCDEIEAALVQSRLSSTPPLVQNILIRFVESKKCLADQTEKYCCDKEKTFNLNEEPGQYLAM